MGLMVLLLSYGQDIAELGEHELEVALEHLKEALQTSVTFAALGNVTSL
jgi:hypothetical protein